MEVILAGLVLLVQFFSVAGELRLCATLEHEASCKKIEASRTEVKCVFVADSVECMRKLQRMEVHFGAFSPEEGLLAASLGAALDVVAEVRHVDRANSNFAFQTVVVVKANYGGGLDGLRNTAYCHPGFSRSQYWTDLVLKAFELKVLESQQKSVRCNSQWRNAYEDEASRLSQIFRKSCRPGEWVVSDYWDKKLKRDYASLCAQCDHPENCDYARQNAGDHNAALRCLTHGNGDVAYTAFQFVEEYFELTSDVHKSNVNASEYRFLCEDGSTRTLASTQPCAWVKQPWTTVLAPRTQSGNVSSLLKIWFNDESRKKLDWPGNLKNILAKEREVIKVLDHTVGIADHISKGRNMPAFGKGCRANLRWCITSGPEQEKCELLRTAALTHGIPTELQCVRASDKHECLSKISQSEADVTAIDTQLGFIARKTYNLTAIAFLETERSGNYYGVAVVKSTSLTTLQELEGKRACFPQYNGLGWLSYVQTARNLSLVPSKLCSDTRSVWNFFSKSCAPGAKDPKVNLLADMVPDNICSGCDNIDADEPCAASGSNPYFGEEGALRCLNNGDGDVAFLDFYSIKKILYSEKRNSTGASIRITDLKILCRDGSVADFTLENPEQCSLTQLNGGEVVTRSHLDETRRRDIMLTLQELDDWFGTNSRHYEPVLRMYEPFDGTENILFKDSAVALVSARETNSYFVNNYVALHSIMDHCYKDSGATTFVSSILVIFLSALIILYDD